MSATSGRWLGLVLGTAADALLGDPRRGHPVAAFGRAATALETGMWADSRRRGAAYLLCCTGSALAVGIAAERACQRPVPRVALVAAATWAVLGGASLAREALILADLLDRGDVEGARARLGHLCGRDPSGLDAEGLARATVESVAENTSDAVVAPLFWGAAAGVPGLLAYRAVNTLDAMVGHRSRRYARFGWAPARLDDLVNLVPARLTGLLAAAAAPLVGGERTAAVRVLRRDAARHPSPNAGWCEAGFAGALGRRLGGTTVYGDRVEQRGPLGDGPSPSAPDIGRAVRLSRAVQVAALAVLVTAGALVRWGVRR